MKTVVITLQIAFLSLIAFSCANATKNDARSTNEITEITRILNEQEMAWNRGDLEAYMQGYWQNDSLTFIGKSGVTYGWQQTLQNYKKSYPTAGAMGKLTFTIIKTELLNPENAHVIGKWHLTREAGNLQGHFSLLWQKINGSWVIVSDHSS